MELKKYFLFIIIPIILLSHINAQYNSECVTIHQKPGRCLPLKSCKFTNDLLYNRQNSANNGENREFSKNDIKDMTESYCGTYKQISHVCCPLSDIQLNPEGLEILKNQTCGVYSVNKVANGLRAALFGFPWMALLKYDDEKDPFKCGGSLISDQYVLTAAHCIKGREKILKQVRLGEYQISTDIDCVQYGPKNVCSPPAEDIEIDKMIVHEDYQQIYNDIALIRLKRKVEFKRNIKPICLPIYKELQNKVFEKYVISGWGKTETGSSSDFLQVAIVSFVDRSACDSALKAQRLRYDLNEGHLCAGGENLVDSCQGDSGGPMGYRDFYHGHPSFIQFGVVSFGAVKCGNANVPGAYANVSHYIQWITDNMRASDTSSAIVFSDEEEQACITPSFENGFCVAYADCPFVNDINRRYGSQVPKYLRDYIFKSKCSADDEKQIRLCCKIPNFQPPTTSSTTTRPTMTSRGSASNEFGTNSYAEDLNPQQDYIGQLNPQGLQILNELSCGEMNGNRVAGGNKTVLAEFPWMVLLRYDTPSDNPWKCGGTLITNRYVLTAAHCVKQNVDTVIGVRLGEHDISQDRDCEQVGDKLKCNPPVEDFGIEKIIAHKYRQTTLANDIALIKLDRNVEFKHHIKPICLPITASSIRGPDSTEKFFIAGWGKTEKSSFSNILLKARVGSLERSKCQDIFKLTINHKNLCAGDLQSGLDSCNGDSGGPLFFFSLYKQTKRFIQYGIVGSGGAVCDLNKPFPTIYTNVINYMPWITDNIVDGNLSVK